jgi:hypothetical protein
MWWKKWWGKRGTQTSGARSSGAPPSSPQLSSVRDLLQLLNNGLEIGMCDNAILTRVFSDLDSMPETLLPDAMPKLTHTAFLLWKCGRGEFAKRLLFTCLAWYRKNSKDHEEISAITENLQYLFNKEGRSLSGEDIQRAAEGGQFGHAGSWRMDIAGLEDPKRVVEISGGEVTTQRTRYAAGFTPLVSSKLPLTTFHGWLKRLDPKVLNVTGRLVMEHVFPLFAELTPEQHVARSERLAALNIALSAEDQADLALLRTLLSEGKQVNLRRHRRYSGGDGLLPRGCYSSICRHAAGSDTARGSNGAGQGDCMSRLKSASGPLQPRANATVCP